MRLTDVMATLDEWFPPALAESWDSIGLSFGRPEAEVQSVLIAVDVTPAVVAQALESKVDLLLTHHPLWLSGVTALRGAKGRMAQDLIAGGIALFNAHTNADRAPGGVNDALAEALGLQQVRPLENRFEDWLLLTVYVPAEHREALIDALSAAGAGTLGDYERCAYTTAGSGEFRPLAGANPFTGVVGEIERVEEDRVEMILPLSARTAVARALLAGHPYEEPAFQFSLVAKPAADTGLGRVGEIAEQSLAEFAERVAAALPATAAGVRFAGDPAARIGTVAVVGGSGGSELGAASRVADVLVTADLKHHVVDEHVAEGGCAVIDVAHWASEWPWCPATAARLQALGLETIVSELVTDPWTGHVRRQS